MPIEFGFEQAHRTSVLDCSGAISGRDLVTAIETLYHGGAAARVLWDFTTADISGILDAELRALVDHPLHRRHGTPRNACALVARDTRSLQRLTPLAEIAARALLPFNLRVFTARAEATAWLGSVDQGSFVVACPYCRAHTPRRGAHLVDALLVTCHRCACTFSLRDAGSSRTSPDAHRRSPADKPRAPEKRRPTPVP